MDYAEKHAMVGLVIPQDVYPAPQPYDRLPNVQFTMRGVLGVRLIDALNPAFNGLDNPGYVPRMSVDAKKITLRLKWPGYAEWKEVVHVFEHTYNLNPNTTRKIAQVIAQKVQVFWNDLRYEHYTGVVDGWQLANFPLERLVLLELRHVSQGSWQPVLAALS
ncbi:hypothetical protein BDY19DRAFT_591608 [Irpex rosettiformis]|uniref:Uncharacterized protein n=1 Tax=Irpex rosettiformis TaxID=378272 RepID=A0ACB8UDG9_9APHY|nr:hypothetical protein BDY19DRAFT_591608 [Irpex rosettiformis]